MEEEVADFVKLKVEDIKITMDSQMTIEFNKAIQAPRIRRESSSTNRRLSSRSMQKDTTVSSENDEVLFDIEDVIKVVVDGEELDDDYNKRIEGLSLIDIEGKNLRIKVNFAKPNDISAEFFDPDRLQIRLVMPMLILDAESQDPLESDYTTEYELNLPP